MANVNPGVTAKSGTIPVSADKHDHGPSHAHAHSHAHGHDHAGHDPAAQRSVPRDVAIAIPRSYKHSMFLASAIERLVIAVLLIGLIWLGIFWAVS